MIIRLILLAIFFFLGYTLFKALTRSLPSGRKPDRFDTSADGEQMVKDPQCGTFLPRSDAVEAVIRGKRHYFCSKQCRDSYEKER